MKLKGTVTRVDEMVVDIEPYQIRAAAKMLFSETDLINMSLQVWLADRLLSTDVQLRETSPGKFVFYEYEDNGNHYSGYFPREAAYREGDEIIWKQYQELLNSLK